MLFTLAPDARFGYFAYPAALLGWLTLTGRIAAPFPLLARITSPEVAGTNRLQIEQGPKFAARLRSFLTEKSAR
jgi:hypothetical protein